MNGRSERTALSATLLLLALSLAACAGPLGGDAAPAADVSAAPAGAPECDLEDTDGLVRAVVDRFDGDYGQVVAWVCAGETIDDVMLALQTSRLTGRPAAEILAASKEVGWQALWKGYDVAPANVAEARVAVPTPAAPGPSRVQGAAPPEQDAQAIRLVTRSGQAAGSAAITWEGDRFLLVGRIARLEPENEAVQVLVPTEGSREATYLVRLPPGAEWSELRAGRWVRIRGERGEGPYLLAHEIEILFAGSAGPVPTPGSAGGGSTAPVAEGDDWKETSGDLVGAGGESSDGDDQDGPDPDNGGDQAGPDGDDGGDQDGPDDDPAPSPPPDGDDDDQANEGKGKDKPGEGKPDKDQDKGKDKGKGKGP